MKARLIFAIISTIFEEVALVVVVLWGLPLIGVRIPLPGIAALMVLWLAFSIITYVIGSRALLRKPVITLPPIIDSRGKVVSALSPEGMVKIKGECWIATSDSGNIDVGADIIVVKQDGLKLTVEECQPE